MPTVARPRVSRFTEANRELNSPENRARRREEALQNGNGRSEPVASDRAEMAELEGMLAIDQSHLELCCTQHPDLLYRVAKKYAYLTSERDLLKFKLEQEEANVYNRERDRVPDGERITEGALKQKVTLDREVTRLNEDLLKANAKLQTWAALKEAVHQRSYMLRELVELYLARYYQGDPARTAEHRMRDHAGERVREARREAGPQGFSQREGRE
jgi:hypothetical protein